MIMKAIKGNSIGRNIGILLIVAGLALSLVGLSRGLAHAQEKPKARAAVEQHFKVVPNVKPSDLEAEIKKLNAQGYIVGQSELIVVGDSITIFVTDEGQGEDE
jgi:hypothetical protein